MPSRHPSALTPPDENSLRTLLPKVIRKFCAVTDCSGVDDTEALYDAWFLMPGMDNEYASLGFELGGEPLYWAVPCPPQRNLESYTKAGYQKSSKYCWQYISLPPDFSLKSESEQEHVLVTLIERLLLEDEQLRGH